MAEETAFENGRISNFEGLVTVTLTFDRVILHTVVQHSPTFTYAKFHRNRRNVLWMDKRKFETGFIRSTLSKSRPKKSKSALEGSVY